MILSRSFIREVRLARSMMCGAAQKGANIARALGGATQLQHSNVHFKRSRGFWFRMGLQGWLPGCITCFCTRLLDKCNNCSARYSSLVLINDGSLWFVALQPGPPTAPLSPSNWPTTLCQPTHTLTPNSYFLFILLLLATFWLFNTRCIHALFCIMRMRNVYSIATGAAGRSGFFGVVILYWK